MGRKTGCGLVLLAALTLTPTSVWADHQVQACGLERSSPHSSESTYIEFVNERSSSAIIFWVNFDGNRQYYRTLNPGESYSQQTYVGHVWVIMNGDSSCNAVVTAGSGGGSIFIR